MYNRAQKAPTVATVLFMAVALIVAVMTGLLVASFVMWTLPIDAVSEAM